jgi:ABC-type multidrug transport system fused ATPase/permease subunit
MTAAASQVARFRGAERPQIAFSNVTLNLGGKAILENISLDVKPGEFLCIIGASAAARPPRCGWQPACINRSAAA